MTDVPTPTGSAESDARSRVDDDRYLEPHQARRGVPTAFENALGDAIETAYAAGIHDLDGLVAHLQASGPQPEDGGPWTNKRFTDLMAELSA